jgi:hypothetical protein
MAERPNNHVPLAVCPTLRHVAHPGYTCAEEEALHARIVAHCGPVREAIIPARALAGTTFGSQGAA